MASRRKYNDCTCDFGDCSVCPKFSGGLDCHGREVTPLEFCRRRARISQPDLAQLSFVGLRKIQKIEAGEVQMCNVSAANFLALADALGVDPHDLL